MASTGSPTVASAPRTGPGRDRAVAVAAVLAFGGLPGATGGFTSGWTRSSCSRVTSSPALLLAGVAAPEDGDIALGRSGPGAPAGCSRPCC